MLILLFTLVLLVMLDPLFMFAQEFFITAQDSSHLRRRLKNFQTRILRTLMLILVFMLILLVMLDPPLMFAQEVS